MNDAMTLILVVSMLMAVLVRIYWRAIVNLLLIVGISLIFAAIFSIVLVFEQVDTWT